MTATTTTSQLIQLSTNVTIYILIALSIAICLLARPFKKLISKTSAVVDNTSPITPTICSMIENIRTCARQQRTVRLSILSSRIISRQARCIIAQLWDFFSSILHNFLLAQSDGYGFFGNRKKKATADAVSLRFFVSTRGTHYHRLSMNEK